MVGMVCLSAGSHVGLHFLDYPGLQQLVETAPYFPAPPLTKFTVYLFKPSSANMSSDSSEADTPTGQLKRGSVCRPVGNSAYPMQTPASASIQHATAPHKLHNAHVCSHATARPTPTPRISPLMIM